MTDADKTVKVEGYQRRKPSEGKARTDKQSQTSDPQSPGATEGGVKVMGKGERGPQGIQRLSKREPGDLETRVELSNDQGKRNLDGRREFES